ncbi:MAG TPA: pyruvate kinase [Thermodesulfobacteriota bacterium]|nr:pyruvate kinase [Deltaproteobacteria bacterium]HNR13832.1 pyruvate kinase [Thermodesulfobacteriota bacterium]HNU72775.1 pyruvate kinase [Thermodesulfobacteriota bacterium]HOC38985.1 pyruvate kinase [Thermodesulfobacteriota bacterium]
MTPLPAHLTKIICTIGPASESAGVIEQMIRAGMTVARLNFSHGTFSSHKAVIENLRNAERATGERVAIMADLPGPKIRIGPLAEEPVFLQPGDLFMLTSEPITGSSRAASVSLPSLPTAVKPGDSLFINDGLIHLKVVMVRGKDVQCEVVVGGELRSRKGVNFPRIDLGISAFTPHDEACLKFAFEHGVDAVSQSFVETAADIRSVRTAAEALGYHPFIIAKIERARALDHAEEIIAAADGIMIARGDLGVEIPIEHIAVVQKQLMHQAHVQGKPVITATQMLESMTTSRRPTRAEATDVANAVLDGTDCVMLSGESALGQYPVDSVAMLASIAQSTEPYRPLFSVHEQLDDTTHPEEHSTKDLIAISVEAAVEHSMPAAVFVPTFTGATARSISRFRLPIWVIGISPQEKTCRELQFSYGVLPFHEEDHPEDWRPFIRKWLQEHGVEGKRVIVIEGPSPQRPDKVAQMNIVDVR